jgi:glycosyltransferase involved in cell wall biosynthesis
VPLVSTRVGQGADLVRDGENGWLADVEDVEALTEATVRVAVASEPDLDAIRREGRRTAEENSYPALGPRWLDLFRGFVELSPSRP